LLAVIFGICVGKDKNEQSLVRNLKICLKLIGDAWPADTPDSVYLNPKHRAACAPEGLYMASIMRDIMAQDSASEHFSNYRQINRQAWTQNLKTCW